MNPIRQPLSQLLLAALVLATIAGFLLISPDRQLPVHWGLDGHVDSTLPRNLALLQMPLATVLVWAIVYLVNRAGNPNRRPGTAAVIRVLVPVLTAIFTLVQLVIVLLGSGVALPFFQAT